MTSLFTDHSQFEGLDYDFGLNQLPDNFYEQALESSPGQSTYQCASSKHSYEYAQTSDYGSDKLLDDDRGSNPKSPSIINKPIQKHHEPIIDNGYVYRYEDDSNEYKKARKRVQNRVSATRVRNKKKTYVEELEGQVAVLKGEINQLKTTNNVLSTENSLLKQQVSFFEKLFSNKQQAPAAAVENNVLDTSSFSFNNDTEIDMEPMEISHESSLYFRSGPRGGLKRHTSFLAVMTVLLCMYGAFTAGEEMQLGNFKAGFLGGNNQVSAFTFNKIGSRSTTQSDGDVGDLDDLSPGGLFGKLVLLSKMAFIMIYVVYAIYVLQKIHRYYFQRNKASNL